MFFGVLEVRHVQISDKINLFYMFVNVFVQIEQKAVLPETFPVPGTVNPQNVPRERGTFPGNVDLNFINEISSFLIY